MKINTTKLKQYRREAKLTQEDMANRLNIPKITYQTYEQGVRNPKADTLKGMAEVLGIDIDCLLLCEEEKMKEAIKVFRLFNITISGIIKSENIMEMTLQEIAEKLDRMK